MKFFVVAFHAVDEPGLCEQLDGLLGEHYKLLTWAGSPGTGWYVVEEDAATSAGQIFEHLTSSLGDAPGELKLFVTEIARSWDGCGDDAAVKAIEAVVPRG